MRMPSSTNGAASPSLAPASAVSAKLGSCSASSPGGPTPMSPASTGSVGASTAPRITAAPSERPITSDANTATAAMVSGIATAISRTTEPHSRHRSRRSSFSPDEKSAKISATSATCSSTLASSSGSIHSMSRTWMAAAATAPSER